MKPANPIILALDYDDLEQARQMVSIVRPYIGMIKIGLELFTAHGQKALELSKEFNVPVFLDLKLHDIPATVGKTTRVICKMLAPYPGPHFLSVHILGDRKMCYQAQSVADSSNVEIVGVTVLTSLDESSLGRLGFRDRRVGVRTAYLAVLASNFYDEDFTSQKGLNGFVCAPAQLKLVRQHLGDDPILISPGIRLPEAKTDDHKKPATIGFALKNGATWVVIGRPITQSPDPLQAARYFKEQADKY